MALSKKTTILFPPDLFDRLEALARRSNTSIGELVRRACRERYRLLPPEDRLAAVRELCALRLPVGDVRRMKKESVPDPEDLLP